MSKINFQSQLGILENQLVELYDQLGESDEDFENSFMIWIVSTILTQIHFRGLLGVLYNVLSHKKNQIKHSNLLIIETLEFMLKSKIGFSTKIKDQTYKNRNFNRIEYENLYLSWEFLEQNQEKLKIFALERKNSASAGCGLGETGKVFPFRVKILFNQV